MSFVEKEGGDVIVSYQLLETVAFLCISQPSTFIINIIDNFQFSEKLRAVRGNVAQPGVPVVPHRHGGDGLLRGQRQLC